jgi:hypothetical protein
MKPLDLALAACTFAAPGLAQIQTAKLQAFDSAQFQSFGTAVAADNGWLVVGVRQDSQIASTAGAAYSYQRSGGAWNFVEKFFSSDIQQGDGFGYSVVMDGATCVIGATYEDPNGVFAAGSVYVFERIGANWIQTQKLGATPAIPNANFGWSIDLDDDRMVVGARGESSRGAAYVFERSAGVWSQTARLQASDVALFDFFGGAVAVEDNTVFVGSTADGPGATDQGAVYVFEFNGVQWLELAKLHASDPQSLSGFGSKLGVRGGTAFIGAHNHAHAGVGGSGSSYVFGDSGATWSETQELQQHAPGIGLLFGVGIRLSDSFAVIGASRDPNNLSGGGATYLFSRGFAGWSELARMSANDALPSDGFGGALAVDDSTVVVGVPGRDDLCGNAPSTCDSGAVYVFEFCPDARQFGWCMSGAPCGNHDKNAGCTNSTGVGATLGAAGSSSVVLDDLRFEARKLQPNKSAVLFMGGGVGQTVLGDGLRVVAGASTGLFRYGVVQSNAEGVAQRANVITHSQNFLPAGRIQPGSVWNFQVWYRDPAGPCSSGTNLTNALEVVFRP